MEESRVGRAWVQATSTGTWDAEPGLVVSIDTADVAINLGEGAQRFANEHKLRLAARLKHVLLTRLTWGAVGGLPGVMLTLHDAKASHDAKRGALPAAGLALFGPRGLQKLMHGLRGFLNPSALRSQLVEVRDGQVCRLGALAATPIVLGGSSSLAGDAAAAMAEDRGCSVPKRQRLDSASATTTAAATVDFLAPSEAVPACICWLLEMPSIPAKFDPVAAQRLGVPNGPLRSCLCRGETVQLEGGVEVRPEEVLGGGQPGEVLLLVDCASLIQLAALRAHPLTLAHASPDCARAATAIFHLTPHAISHTEEYTAFTASVPPQTRQFGLHGTPQPQRFALCASARLQRKLAAIHSGIFPPPRCLVGRAQFPAKSVAELDMLTRFVLRPAAQAGICREAAERLFKWTDTSGRTLTLDEAEIRAEVAALAPLAACLAALPPKLHEPLGTLQCELRAGAPHDAHVVGAGALSEDEPEEVAARAVAASTEARLVFLGTGAAVPAKYRNVSSFLMETGRRDGSCAAAAVTCGMLFDAGEGTMSALRRHFGENAPNVVRALGLVWISHMHADHHLGLVTLLGERQPEHPLVVVGPESLGRWLREAAAALEQPLSYRFVSSAAAPSSGVVTAALQRLGITDLRVAPVVHCPDAWAVAVQHLEGWGLVYSGDTRPCDAVVQLGLQLAPTARILVHEATFDDTEEMRDEAVAKRHSTISEALEVGASMRAWRVILTHFSQRYPKLTDLRASKSAAAAVIAFDQMSAPLRLLAWMPRLTPALQCLFADEFVDLREAEAPVVEVR